MAGRRRADGEAVAPSLPVSRSEYAAIAVVAALFVTLRVPLFTRPGVLLGWNSDAAGFGIMARSIAAGRSFPLFFFGQSYLGPLTSWLTVAVAPLAGGVGPLALRLAASLEVFAGILFYWLSLRRTFNPPVAMIVAAWLAAAPGWFLQFTTAPIGAEQLFLLSGAIAWYAARSPMRSWRAWFLLGVLAGFGWWMYQAVVFVVAAVIATAILRSDWWAVVRPGLHVGARLTLRYYALSAPARFLLQATNVLLAFDLMAGLLFSFRIQTPALFLHDPVAEPLLALVAFHLIVAAVNRRAPAPWPPLREATAFAVGMTAGYAPVIAGYFSGAYVHRYGFSAPALGVGDVPAHVRAVAGDLGPFLAGTGAPLVALIIAGFFVSSAVMDRRPIRLLFELRQREWGGRTTAALTILFAGCFYAISERAHPGSMRYMVPALPFVYAFTVAAMMRLRLAGLVAAAVVAVGMLVPRIEQVRDVAAARSENYSNFAGDFDPRPTLAAIRRGGYRVCYADYWIAYKLDWVSEGSVRFVPWRSYDRDPAESVRLTRLSGKKCFVPNDGSVRPLGAELEEGATSTAARERLRRLGEESVASRPELNLH